MDQGLERTIAKKGFARWSWGVLYFIEESAQYTLLFNLLPMVMDEIFHNRSLFLILIDKKLNKYMAGVASTTSLTRLGNRFNIFQFALGNGISDGAFFNLITLANDFVCFNSRRKIHKLKTIK